MSDTTEKPPAKIWLEWMEDEGCLGHAWDDPNIGIMDAEYIRADLAEAIVRAAWERAVEVLERHRDYGMVGPDGDFLGSEAEVIAHGNSVHYAMQDVLSLASDAEVAAIIKKAGEDRG